MQYTGFYLYTLEGLKSTSGDIVLSHYDELVRYTESQPVVRWEQRHTRGPPQRAHFISKSRLKMRV